MQSGSLTAVTSVLFGGTERVFPQVKTPLGHSQIIVYCQSQQTAARDRRFQRVCGRWLSGGEGLCGGVWVSCSAWQRTTQQANIECAAAERGFVWWRVGVVFCLTAHNTAGKYRCPGGIVYRGLWEMDEGGTRNGAFLTEKAQCGGPLGRAPVLETLEDMLRKALDNSISLHRGPVGEPGRDSLAETFGRKG